MARIAVVCAAVLVVSLALIAGLGNAQLTRLVGPDKEAILYDGDLELDSGGIDVVSWGSGAAEPVYDETYVGPQVLKVTSQGPYQGIVLQLGRPARLKDFLATGNAYVDVRVLPGQPSLEYRRLQEATLRQQLRAATGVRGGRGGGGMRGGGGGRGGGMRGGGGGRGGGMRGGGGGRGGGMRGGGGGRGGGMRGGGGGRGGGMRGGGGGRGGGMRGGGMRGGGMRGGGRAGTTAGRAPGGAAASTDEKVFTARNLRLVLFTDEGMVEASAVPVVGASRDKRGWVPVRAALSEMAGAEGAAEVRAVGVFTDESEVFYLGRVSIVADSKPVEVTVKAEPLFARPRAVITFSASLRGGLVDPKTSWDFDQRDGIQRQALGREVKFLYDEPGDYLVTCTVTDKSGLREAATAEVGIRVEGSPEPEQYAY
jgi:hypothetical protein